MPEKLSDVKIAVLDKIGIRKTTFDLEMKISSAENLEGAVDYREKVMEDFVSRLRELGVGAVFTKDEIDPIAADMMARSGIMAFEKVKEDDLKRIEDATGAIRVGMDDLGEDVLGFAGVIEDLDDENCEGGVCRT